MMDISADGDLAQKGNSVEVLPAAPPWPRIGDTVRKGRI